MAPGGARQDIYSSLGFSGLPRWSGFVYDEFLLELQGPRGRRVFREMADNDSTVGALLFAITMLCRRVEWSIRADEDAPDDDRAEFIDSCVHDMVVSWHDRISEILSFLPYGWALHEQIYKKRDGTNSKYSDGKIGWYDWALRGQETLLKWEFDDAGGILGMWQLGPPDYREVFIPMTKALLFRTSVTRGNPEGRALEWSMKVPTPHGWRQIGDLAPGASVFDEQGRVRYITARADWQDRPCFRLTFADGTSIVADAAHEWVTQTQSERTHRLPGKCRTTQEIADTLKTNRGVSNHSIPWSAPLDYPEQHLPLSPYTLGLWLGDGHARSMMITCHADDVEETCALIHADGYATDVKPNGVVGGNGRLLRVYGKGKWDSSGPSAALRVFNLVQNKHIPDAYLRGSIGQRRALLAGLMDSDGTVDRWGRCEFTNTNPNLVDGVAELVRSLGVGVTFRTRAPNLLQKRVTESRGVKFTPPWSPFRLKRKAGRIINQHARRQHYVVACEPVAASHTVCIEVDGPSHLFLAGEAMVPTHNSILRNAYRAWYFKKNVEIFEGIGIERDLAGLPVLKIPGQILEAANNPNATPQDSQALTAYQELVRQVKVNEGHGVILPSDVDPESKTPLYDFSLLTSGGKKQFDTNEVINRLKLDITQTVLADFLQVGHASEGSHALAEAKTDLFSAALQAVLHTVISGVNDVAIPRLLKLNGMPTDNPPKLVHGDIDHTDLDALGTYVLHLAQAGFQLDTTWDGNLLKDVLQKAGLSEPPEQMPEVLNEPVTVYEQDTEQNPDDAAAAMPLPGKRRQPARPGQPAQQPGTSKTAAEPGHNRNKDAAAGLIVHATQRGPLADLLHAHMTNRYQQAYDRESKRHKTKSHAITAAVAATLQADAQAAAESITGTYDSQVTNAQARGEDQQTVDGRRSAYKPEAVLAFTGARAARSGLLDFYHSPDAEATDTAQAQTFHVEPSDAVCETCQGLADMGNFPLAVAESIDVPVHENCPHTVEPD